MRINSLRAVDARISATQDRAAQLEYDCPE